MKSTIGAEVEMPESIDEANHHPAPPGGPANSPITTASPAPVVLVAGQATPSLTTRAKNLLRHPYFQGVISAAVPGTLAGVMTKENNASDSDAAIVAILSSSLGISLLISYWRCKYKFLNFSQSQNIRPATATDTASAPEATVEETQESWIARVINSKQEGAQATTGQGIV